MMTRYDQAVLVVANALANRLQYERRQEPLQGWDYANKVLEIVLDHYERETGLTAFDLMDDAYNLITGRAEGVSKLSSVLSSCWMELVSVSNHSDNYYLAIATTAALLVLFIKAAVVFAAAALIGKLFGIWKR